MVALDFPDAPTNGQVFDKWTWNGSAWVLTAGGVVQGMVGYAQRTTDQGGIVNALVDIVGLSVTFTATAGRIYRISSHIPVTSSANQDQIGVYIMTGAGAALAAEVVHVAFNNFSYPGQPVTVQSALSGSVTVKIAAYRAGGTGTGTVKADATYPAWIMVEDITFG